MGVADYVMSVCNMCVCVHSKAAQNGCQEGLTGGAGAPDGKTETDGMDLLTSSQQ